MINEITNDKLFEYFMDTLNLCGSYLYTCNKDIIEYNIFEEFDIGVISFLHDDSLAKLKKAGFIDEEIVIKCKELRELVISIQNSNKWNIESIQNSKEWRRIISISENIMSLIKMNNLQNHSY